MTDLIGNVSVDLHPCDYNVRFVDFVSTVDLIVLQCSFPVRKTYNVWLLFITIPRLCNKVGRLSVGVNASVPCGAEEPVSGIV